MNSIKKHVVETAKALFVVEHNEDNDELIIGVDTFDGLGVVKRDLSSDEAKDFTQGLFRLADLGML